MSMEPTPINRKTRCPVCAKSLYITQEDCGRCVFCPACGTSTRIPLLPPEVFLPPEEMSSATEMDDMVYGIPVPPTVDAEPPRAASSRSRRRPALLTLLVCLILAQSLLVAWLVKDRPPVIPDATRTAMLEAKQKADDSFVRGDLLAAHQQYQALQETAARLDIRDDPQIVAAVNDARQSQGLVLERLLRREAVRQAMAAPMPATLPAAPPSTQPAVASVEPAPTTQPIVVVEIPELPKPVPATQPVVAPVAPRPPSLVVLPKRPPVRPTRMPQEALSDEEIGRAIERSVDNLIGQMNGSMIRGTRPNDGYSMGVNALCVYALLQAGQAISDERLNVRAKFMKDVLSAMRDMPVGGGPETYTRGIRATALALYNRPEDRQQLKADVSWLVANHSGGAYTYARTAGRQSWDNSNSQYGLLGVWSGAEAGVEVPSGYWSAVQNHWTSNQCPNGEWGYTVGSDRVGRLSMSVAGIASLFVTHDYLEAPSFGSAVGRDPFSPSLARALGWLEAANNVLPDRLDGYTLYGIERVGLASGFKYFGSHDWYRELAKWIIDGQNPRGAWGGGGFMGGGEQSAVQSAYCLLFLARGRHPILMNKLRFDGAWANRPRDLANLARYASAQLERPLNWQVVPLSRDWTDWTDSPILYLASHQAVPLKEQDYVKLRRYINSGGLLFTQADGGSTKFNQFVLDLARKLTPDYEWADLPADHDVFSVNFPITARPKLRCISNGVRLLMVHSPEDISQWWQLRAEKTRQPTFEFGANLFIHTAGKSDLRNRLTSTVIPSPQEPAGFNLAIAHVRYGGNWNPEPAALERFASLFQYQTGYGLQRDVVDMEDLRAARWPIALMTGTSPFSPAPRQIEAIRKFVEDGGTLYIDAAGGSALYSTSVNASLLAAAFPGRATVVLNETHPIIAGAGDGMDGLGKPQLRSYAERKLGRAAARIEMLTAGNGRVIFSPIDTTFGLLGTNTWGVLGYKPAYAQGLLRNVILWAMDGAQDSQAAVR